MKKKLELISALIIIFSIFAFFQTSNAFFIDSAPSYKNDQWTTDFKGDPVPSYKNDDWGANFNSKSTPSVPSYDIPSYDLPDLPSYESSGHEVPSPQSSSTIEGIYLHCDGLGRFDYPDYFELYHELLLDCLKNYSNKSKYTNWVTECYALSDYEAYRQIIDICDELKKDQSQFCPLYSYRSNKDYLEIQENKHGCVCISGYEWNKNNTVCVEDTCEKQYAVNFGKSVDSSHRCDGDRSFTNTNGACCACLGGYRMDNNQEKCIPEEEYDKISQNRPNGTLVKLEGGMGIYQIENGKKRPIKSATTFLAKGYKWGDVVEISWAEMNGYSIGRDLIIDENNQDRETPSKQESVGVLSNGMLVRVKGTHGVYSIYNNQKRPIKSAEIFLSRGYKWEDIIEIDQSALDICFLGSDITLSENMVIENDTQTITINVPKLRIRSFPNLEGKIIALAPEGQNFFVIDEQIGWYKIEFKLFSSNDVKTGWVMSKYTK